MKVRGLVGVIALVSIMGWPARTDAASFTLESFKVTTPSDPGLALVASSLVSGPDGFSLLDVGDTYVLDLFTIGTTENSLSLDDFALRPVTVSYEMTANGAEVTGGQIGMSAGYYSLLDAMTVCAPFVGCFPVPVFEQRGGVGWGDPAMITFGSTGLLSVMLSDVSFTMNGFANVSATFRLEREDINPAPEPASLLLVGAGLAAGARRLRSARRSAAAAASVAS